MNFSNSEDKQVQYMELIYDLIFVYMIGRNNALLNNFENGFVSPESFCAYALSALAIIQIWNFSTFYINMFGRNGIRDHVFLFINMYLIYFIGEATRSDWEPYQAQYHIAWGLILLNIGIQYLVELRNHKMDVWNRDIIKRMAITLFVEAIIVFIAVFLTPIAMSLVSLCAIITGVIMTALGKHKSPGGQVDFAHLTERAMLFVVLTFGEMIITVASYFVGGGTPDLNVIYYSLMTFIIVTGLFLSYEVLYEHIIDRQKNDNGMLYILIHIFVIFALNNITMALEFMREEEIYLLPKMLFLVLSVVGYYIFLFCLGAYSKKKYSTNHKFIASLVLITVLFIILMVILREMMALNIFITALYVYTIYATLIKAKRKS